jgi:hypothetical protein
MLATSNQRDQQIADFQAIDITIDLDCTDFVGGTNHPIQLTGF